MFKKYRYYFFLLAAFLFSALPAFYYLVLQFREDKIVHQYLSANQLDKLPLSKGSAFAIARQVASDFNVDERTFKVLKMNERPFLREDAGELLTYKEGQCGEGTRVIVRLLNVCGYDATRITLYDKYMQHAHTLVSVRTDSVQFWIDSINSSDSLTSLLKKETVSDENFGYLFYSDNINDRLEKVRQHKSIEESEDFKRHLGKYFLFSFEAIPMTKIMSKLGFEVRVFNLQRPPRLVSVLAEKPNTIRFIAYLALAFVITFIASRVLRPLRVSVR